MHCRRQSQKKWNVSAFYILSNRPCAIFVASSCINKNPSHASTRWVFYACPCLPPDTYSSSPLDSSSNISKNSRYHDATANALENKNSIIFPLLHLPHRNSTTTLPHIRDKHATLLSLHNAKLVCFRKIFFPLDYKAKHTDATPGL